MNDYTAETGNSRNLRRGAHQLLELYRGHWGQLFWAAFWFTVKHSPAWVTPIVIANIINIVTDPEHHNLTQFWLNLIVGSVFIAQNVLTAWLHTRASSGLTRGVEMELRGAMVHKLQRLSIQYHTQAQTGRLLSKIMRDVENVEQMMQSCFSSIVPLVTSVTVAVVVTALSVRCSKWSPSPALTACPKRRPTAWMPCWEACATRDFGSTRRTRCSARQAGSCSSCSR